MKRCTPRLALVGFLLLSAPPAEAQSPDLVLRELTPSATEAVPPLPVSGVFPIQMVLDDGSAETSIGVTSMAGPVPFLWFNQFAATGVPFELREIWVLFPSDPNFGPGDAIQLVVYQDDNGDPEDGATLLLTLDETIQAADDTTFSVYVLPDPLPLSGDSETLLGVVNRFFMSGVSPFSFPAAMDTDTSQGRSWVGIWTAGPPDPPELPPDEILLNTDDQIPGNFMVRGFGIDPALPVPVPTLGPASLGALVLLLAAAGAALLLGRG